MAHILTLNAGSSSLKFGLYARDDAEPRLLASGLVDRIGAATTLEMHSVDGATLVSSSLDAGTTHAGAVQSVLAAMKSTFPDAQVDVVGHRIVHGGLECAAPIVLNPEVITYLETLVPFAPLHQPHNLAGVAAAQAAFPDAGQVACFDTAFHRNHPYVNDTFALPRKFYDKGVRRYGFHGLSYDYIASTLSAQFPDLHAGRVVVAHLGNGASMCAMREGQSVASSMGFSALDGLPMGTRSGQLDPGVVLYLLEQEGMTAPDIADLLYKRSGLLGLSGISSDMRTLLASDAPVARQALDYFCFRIRRELGGLAAALGGLDALVFTGGIGENAAQIREEVCDGMGWIGIEVDAERNSSGQTLISADGSDVSVLVVPTDEERVIARAAIDLTGGEG